MCGRFDFHTPPNLLAQRYWEHAGPVASTAPRYNIAPGTDILSICFHANIGLSFELARWGFRPDWASGKAPVPINARIESLGSPYFRDAFARHRCLIPANGWFEWQHTEDGKKRPYYITCPTLAEDEALFFAGIYTPVEAEKGIRTAIITEPSADPIRHIHDRQPVLIHPESLDYWLDPGQEGKALKGRIKRTSAEVLGWWPVSDRVNRPTHDETGLIEPLDEQ